MINTAYSNDKTKLNSFKKKFTASNLKKRLKCKEVIELKSQKLDVAILKSMTEIDEASFVNLTYELQNFDMSSLQKNCWYKTSYQKYFAFSDDVIDKIDMIEKIKNEAVVTLFEVDEEDIDTFIENIENIKSNNESIDDLKDAKDTLDTLQNFENQFDLSLTSYDADDEIDTAIDNLEIEVNDAHAHLSECLMWS